MGGGSSRLNAAEGEVVPVKIRPLLVRRFEELRKRRNGATTLSQKQLLKDVEEEDDNSQSSHEIETEDKVSSKDIEPAKEEILVRVITIEKLSIVVPLPNSECECKTEEEKDPNKGNTEQDNQHKDQDQEKVIRVDEKAEAEAEVKTEEGMIAESLAQQKPEIENEQEVDEKSDDDDDESEEYGRLLCPGSPSFRIYCIEAEKRKEEEESKNQTIAMHKKSPSADSVESDASRNSGNSNEVLQVVKIESTRKKKGNKTKKFGAVKTLLKVKSCYHPMCTCTGDDRSGLLVAKATN